MPADPTPAEVGRMHALHRCAEAVNAIASAHEAALAQDGLADADRAYLAAVVTHTRAIAARLRASPGASP